MQSACMLQNMSCWQCWHLEWTLARMMTFIMKTIINTVHISRNWIAYMALDSSSSRSLVRLPSCKWAKIVRRSQERKWRTKVKIVEGLIDRSSGRIRITVVWNDDGQRSIYDKNWLVKMWSGSKVCCRSTLDKDLHIGWQADTAEAQESRGYPRSWYRESENCWEDKGSAGPSSITQDESVSQRKLH